VFQIWIRIDRIYLAPLDRVPNLEYESGSSRAKMAKKRKILTILFLQSLFALDEALEAHPGTWNRFMGLF